MFDPLDATEPLEEPDEPESVVAPEPELLPLPELGLLLFVPDPAPLAPLDPAPLPFEPLDRPLLDVWPDPPEFPLPFPFPLLPLPFPLDPEVEEHPQTIPKQAKRAPRVHFIPFSRCCRRFPCKRSPPCDDYPGCERDPGCDAPWCGPC